MNDLDTLLAVALSSYSELLQVYQELEEVAGLGDAKELEVLLGRMAMGFEVAQAADQNLRDVLGTIGSSYLHLPKMQEYHDVLVQVAERNRVLLGRAQTNQALVACELSEIRAGRAALAGYRVQPNGKGSSLSETY